MYVDAHLHLKRAYFKFKKFNGEENIYSLENIF